MTERLEKILVPLDGSELATAAVDYASMLATATGAHVVLFTAVGGDERIALEDFARHEGIALDEAATAHLRRVAASVADDVAVDIHHEYSTNPASSIVDYARTSDASMIVVASHGRSGVSRWLLGSVADKIVRTSPVPVVVIPVRP